MQNGGSPSGTEVNPPAAESAAAPTATVGDVVRRLCPVLRLHPQETCFPCSAEWFVERADLRWLPEGREKEDKFEIIAAEGQVTVEQLRDEPKNPKYSGNPANLQLQISNKYRAGVPQAELNNVPVYAHVKFVTSPNSKRVAAMEINYMMLYPFNGSYPIFGVPAGDTGSHPGDWEHLTVRTDAAGEPQAVWYNAHRNIDGSWLPWHAVPLTSAGRPIAYVAKHGHGTYPAPGTQLRALMAVNDVTSDKGPIWAPTKVVLFQNPDAIQGATQANNEGTSYQLYKPPSDMAVKKRKQEEAIRPAGDTLPELVVDTNSAWTAFPGRWGGVSAPVRQRWFKECEPPMSRTKMQRILQFGKPSKIPPALKAQTTADPVDTVDDIVTATVNAVM